MAEEFRDKPAVVRCEVCGRNLLQYPCHECKEKLDKGAVIVTSPESGR